VGTALLAAGAAGLREQAQAAIATILSRAARFEPDPAGAETLAVRAQRFDELRVSAALHGGGA
jgi:hypothetical protein